MADAVDKTAPPKSGMKGWLLLGLVGVIAAGAGGALPWLLFHEPHAEAALSRVTQDDVIPLMLLRCTVCHGLRRQEAGLDLRSKESMLKGGKSGPAIVLGKPDESLLVKRVRSGEMPPKKRLIQVGVKPMAPAEIDKIARWIELGAPIESEPPDLAATAADPLVSEKDRHFWSFQPPQRRKSQPLPVLTNRCRRLSTSGKSTRLR